MIYTVTADFTDAKVAAEWVAWLRDGHMAEVVAGGALDAMVVRVEPTEAAPLRFEARYRFADLAAFERYERETAPRLRAEGLARFPFGKGVTLKRSLAEVLATVAAS